MNKIRGFFLLGLIGVAFIIFIIGSIKSHKALRAREVKGTVEQILKMEKGLPYYVISGDTIYLGENLIDKISVGDSVVKLEGSKQVLVFKKSEEGFLPARGVNLY
ncbi:MAG: hypothetical protein ACK5DD_13965 [Cyclobacteriaceae bacterium]|jgi:hypothetical protein